LESEPIRGGLHDYIFRMPRETLIRWALVTERYHRKVNNQEHLLGGLDDYINRLSNQEIVSVILKEADEHPEIASSQKLESLTVEYGMGTQNTEAPRMGGDGGLHDFIWRLPREKLNSWALATEAYHRDINHQHLMGGLDDYVTSLTNEQVVEYIMKEVKEHPEIANQEKLDSLTTKYNINVNSVHQPIKEVQKSDTTGRIGGDGGLHDYIWRLPRATLESWAFATEKYHNKNEQLLGGLHDYIASLTNQQVIDFVMKEVKEHPEIASGEKLDSLVTQYGLGKADVPMVYATNPILGGGLHDVLRTLERKTLISYALAMDEYSHEKVPRIGGIHDYVYNLSDIEITNFIILQSEKFPELNSKLAIDGLVQKYGITVSNTK